MVTEAKIEYRANPLRQGSRNRRGDQVDRELTQYLLRLLGDVRALWLPAKSGTTLTDRSRNALVLTWSEEVSSFDAKPAERGSGYAVAFNGTDEEGDTPDAADLSFGDGAADQPFSLIALVNPDVVNVAQDVISKYDLTTGSTKREWFLQIDASGYPRFWLFDESAGARIARADQTALTAGTWVLLVATYDGSMASTGIRIYKNGARVDDTDDNNGTYTATENTASLVRVAFSQGTAAGQNFLDGKLALACVTGKELSLDDVWALKEAVNGYFGLSL